MKKHEKHGHAPASGPTPEYTAYLNARARCRANGPNAKYYSQRGIKFCFNSFKDFLAEVGTRPGPEYSLDRINNNGSYEPGNLRWATKKQQAQNQRQRKQLEDFSLEDLYLELATRLVEIRVE